MKRCHYIIIDRHRRVIDQSDALPQSIAIHSCAKPFQMLPVCLLGLDEAYEMSHQELAIMSSSMLAQSDQVRVVRGLLQKTRITFNHLQLEPVAPAGYIAYRNWKSALLEKSALFHPCIGNHIAMYLVQRELTGDGADYLKPDSDVQRMILRIVGDFCGETNVVVSVDGCGAPCYEMPLQSLALGYCNLCPKENGMISHQYGKAVRRIWSAIHEHPTFLEGDGCLSTILSSNSGLIGKTGSNATLAIGISEKNYGVAIHSHDNDWAGVANTVKEILQMLSFDNEELYHNLDVLAEPYSGSSL